MFPQTAYIGNPVLSLQTMLRQISFQYPSIPRLIPDGFFGEQTLEAVMVFQREFFPPVTGRVDNATWNAISALYHTACSSLASPLPCRAFLCHTFTISPDEQSVHLYVVQSMFKGLSTILEGVENAPVTGVQDAATQHNTRWIQRLNGREETGIMDKDSWDTLSRLYTIFVTYAQTPWYTRPEIFATG